MAKIFITLTGTKHYFGNDFLKKGMKVRLEKDPDNEYDKERMKDLGRSVMWQIVRIQSSVNL